MKLVFLAFLTFVSYVLAQDEDLIVDVGTLGRIRGTLQPTVNQDRKMRQFIGIPYGETTAGLNRFKPPIRKAAFDVPIFDAINFMPPCTQVNSASSEDCLGLNIWTPEGVTSASNLPVIVFVPGGSFIDGSGDTYNGGRLLATRDLVLVSINYRVGILGFFCLEDDDVPGNAAMYDMVEAFRWVKEHIRNFGGNPDLVTAAGQSAGGALVGHILTSPLAKEENLFQRVLPMSGSSLHVWATAFEPLQAALSFAAFAGCYSPGSSVDKVVIASCMRGVPGPNLVQLLMQYQAFERKEGRLGFAPVNPSVQKGLVSVKPFLAERPIDIMKAGEQSKVPLMIGTTRHDGTFAILITYHQFLLANGYEQDSEFLKSELVPMVLRTVGINDDTYAMYETIGEKYMGDQTKTGNFTLMTPGIIDMHSAFFFKASSYRAADMHSKLEAKSFLYSFDFKGTKSSGNTLPIPVGVGHAHDLWYLFPWTELTDPSELEMSRVLVNYWANFATSGDPNVGPELNLPSWPPISDKQSFIQMGNGKDMNDTFTVGNDYPNTWHDLSWELMPFQPEKEEEEPPTSTVDCNKETQRKQVFFALFITFLVISVVAILCVLKAYYNYRGLRHRLTGKDGSQAT